MEREDYPKIVHTSVDKGCAGFSESSEDMTEVVLKGNINEVSLIIRGLIALKGQLLLETATRDTTGFRYDTDLQVDVDKLLKEISTRNQVADLVAENRYL